ncbi:MAG: ExeA family protein [Hyphomonadaceae bacterium]
MTAKHQPNPRKRQHPITPIGQLLNKYVISLQDVKDCLVEEGVKFTSRSTLHRLVHDRISAELKAELYPKLIRCLTRFLIARGLDKTEIDEQMLLAFEHGEYQPMISQRLELSPQALKYFGLPKDPFTDPPQSRDEVFISPQLRQVIDRIVDGVRYQHFISVIGDIGAGKSTLRALLVDQIANEPKLSIVWPEFFDMVNVSPMQIAEAILVAFQTPVPSSAIKRGNAVKTLLADLYSNGHRVAIGIDEGHRLNDKALSSLKNFLEMNSGGFQRYLGVIIFAQPLLTARLRQPLFQEIYERIVPVYMPEFRETAADYLAHRLQLVGADIRQLFDDEAVDLISSQATTPLSVGNIANEALKISMESFDNKKVIGSSIKTKMFFENRVQGFSQRKAA